MSSKVFLLLLLLPSQEKAHPDTMTSQIATLSFILAISFFACREAAVVNSPEDYPSLVGKEFPDFELLDMQGHTLRWSELKGKPALVNFWFTKCPPCVAEMPHLNQIRRDFSGEDLVFLAISPDDSFTIRNFLNQREYNFDIIPNAADYINFFGNEYPLNVFVDKKGIIRHARGAIPMSFDAKHPQGFMDDRDFRRMLGNLLRDK